MKRSGRRPGTPNTRAVILTAARRLFAAHGFHATSLRTIAAEAKVDPALLIHYFGSKEDLFVAAVRLPFRPTKLFGELENEPLHEAIRTLVRIYLTVVDSDHGRNPILALVRSVVSNEKAATMLREFFTAELLDPVARLSPCPDAPLRASLIAAQLVGIGMLRHVVRLSPLATASTDQLVELAAPAVEHYLKCD